jgi:hypothetical protein
MIVLPLPEELSDKEIRSKKLHNLNKPQKQTIDDLSEENPVKRRPSEADDHSVFRGRTELLIKTKARRLVKLLLMIAKQLDENSSSFCLSIS